MKKFKRFSVILLILAFVTILSSCAGSGDREILQVINFRPEDQGFYIWLEDEFEAEYPNIDVVYEAVDTAGYAAFMKARIQSGEVDVFGSQPANVNTAKTLEDSLPLNDLNIWDKIVDSAKNEVKISTGEYLMAPLSYHTEIVFYNKDIFEQFGWAVPTTWNEFVTLLQAAKVQETAKTIKAPIVYGGLDVWPMAMITEALAGTTILQDDPDFLLRVVQAYQNPEDNPDRYFANNPSFVEFFNRWRVLVQYLQKNSTGLQYSRAPGEFGKGGYAMMIDGSWSLSQILEVQPDFELGAFVLPGNDDPLKNEYAAGKGSAAFSIYKNSDSIEEAKLFIEYLYNEEVYTRYINTAIGQPIMEGIELENDIAKEIFRFKTVLTLSNQWVEKMPYDLIMKQDIGPYFINGTMDVTTAINLIDTEVKNQSEIWLQYAQKYIDKFHPQTE
jgi:raffinose/stachyose/melibiose transport system substrate-binding protein